MALHLFAPGLHGAHVCLCFGRGSASATTGLNGSHLTRRGALCGLRNSTMQVHGHCSCCCACARKVRHAARGNAWWPGTVFSAALLPHSASRQRVILTSTAALHSFTDTFAGGMALRTGCG